MIRNILRRTLHPSFIFRIKASISTKEQFLGKLARKQYMDILGIKPEDRKNLEAKNIHKSYLNQIKKYHSDIAHDQITRVQCEEITKCITQAYEQIKKQHPSLQKGTNYQQIYSFQDEVSQQLFQKKFIEIKHSLYQPGNEQMRAKFIDALNAKRSTSSSEVNRQESTRQYQSKGSYSNYSSESQGPKLIGIVALLCLGIGIAPFTAFNSSKQKKILKDGKQITLEEQASQYQVRAYTQKQLDQIYLNTNIIRSKPAQRFLNNLSRRRPHMLSYPGDKDPDILQQLATYSIAPDIHLFEIPSKYLLFKEQCDKLYQENSDQSIEKYELTNTKPNTLLSLSLQAERTLHNVYVKVDDVLREIKQQGRYTPPSILFKFKGYMMFKLREKNFSNLLNYRNTQYISLFDLYFDYYTPIFFRRTYFNMYLVGLDEEQPVKNARYFGNVQINHRSIPVVFLQKGQKIVIMRKLEKAYNKFNKLKDSELYFQQNWQNYYRTYQQKWKEQFVHQKPSYNE